MAVAAAITLSSFNISVESKTDLLPILSGFVRAISKIVSTFGLVVKTLTNADPMPPFEPTTATFSSSPKLDKSIK